VHLEQPSLDPVEDQPQREAKKIFNHFFMMTDEQLFLLCKRYGTDALEARRKFEGLLPEVNRRRLYERRGFESIFVFAAKLAGLSREQVQRVLQVERKFEDKPALKQALVSGEVSVNKLARVASIATPENEEELAEKAKMLSQKALEVLVRDEKSVRAHTNLQQSLPDVNLLEHLSPELQKNLIQRLEKGINISALLAELLQKHDLELAQEREKLAAEELEKQSLKRKGNSATAGTAAAKPSRYDGETRRALSRYIPVEIRRHLRKKYGTKCSIRTCTKPAEHIHHTQRFALSQGHDPRYLAPLCKEHHEIAHSIDAKYHIARQY
jgi:hypothetical protein